jgi:hypothetical protein
MTTVNEKARQRLCIPGPRCGRPLIQNAKERESRFSVVPFPAIEAGDCNLKAGMVHAGSHEHDLSVILEENLLDYFQKRWEQFDKHKYDEQISRLVLCLAETGKSFTVGMGLVHLP